MFTKYSAKFHTHTRCSSSSFIVTLSLIRRTACARAQFSGCSSTSNARSETGQMAVCCQNLTLGVLRSRSALSVLVGALFNKFGPFLNMPRISMSAARSIIFVCMCVCVCMHACMCIYVRMYVCMCMHVGLCMYVCMNVCICVCVYVCMYVCMSMYVWYVRMYVCMKCKYVCKKCMYVGMYVLCVYVCTYVRLCVDACMYVCVCMYYVCMYICMYLRIRH